MNNTIRSVSLALAAAVGLGGVVGAAEASGGAEHPHQHEWSFQGGANTYFGNFEQDALQRGYQVYKEVCAACHSLNYLSYRNLSQKGGPGFTAIEVEVLAAESKVPAGPDDFGEILDEDGFLRMRPAMPSDRFAKPYLNEQAARAANSGALPPDLSIITKARHDGVNYVFSLLSGFAEGDKRPACLGETPGQYYNPYFGPGSLPDSCIDEEGHATIPGSLIAMAPPLNEGAVTYMEDTEATVEQMAADVATFLAWAAEPHMEQRKQMGFQVMIYLFILSIFLYLSYRRVWRDVGH